MTDLVGRPGSTAAVVCAILTGSALIAAAIYFQPRNADVGAPVGSPGRAAPSAAAVDLAARDFYLRVGEQARLAMEKQRSVYSGRCWQPLLKTGGPKQAVYAVTLSFDEQGHETRREFAPAVGQPARADVLDCLRKLDGGVDVAVPPPGKPVTVTVEYNFP